MSFIRIKKLKGKKYAYLVENKWQKTGSRQKVIAYLGRIFSFQIEHKIDFLGQNLEEYIKNNNPKDIIKEIVKANLTSWGFEIKNELIIKESIIVDLNKKTIRNNKFNAAIEMNEGYLCDYTLKNLINVKIKGEDVREKGYNLAKAFIDAGLNIPQEAFVLLFQKMTEE